MGTLKTSGKNYGKNPEEKLPHIWPITTILIPDTKSFAVVKFAGDNPEVMLGSVTIPLYKKLPAMASLLNIKDFFH